MGSCDLIKDNSISVLTLNINEFRNNTIKTRTRHNESAAFFNWHFQRCAVSVRISILLTDIVSFRKKLFHIILCFYTSMIYILLATVLYFYHALRIKKYLSNDLSVLKLFCSFFDTEDREESNREGIRTVYNNYTLIWARIQAEKSCSDW